MNDSVKDRCHFPDEFLKEKKKKKEVVVFPDKKAENGWLLAKIFRLNFRWPITAVWRYIHWWLRACPCFFASTVDKVFGSHDHLLSPEDFQKFHSCIHFIAFCRTLNIWDIISIYYTLVSLKRLWGSLKLGVEQIWLKMPWFRDPGTSFDSCSYQLCPCADQRTIEHLMIQRDPHTGTLSQVVTLWSSPALLKHPKQQR